MAFSVSSGKIVQVENLRQALALNFMFYARQCAESVWVREYVHSLNTVLVGKPGFCLVPADGYSRRLESSGRKEQRLADPRLESYLDPANWPRTLAAFRANFHLLPCQLSPVVEWNACVCVCW